MKKMGFGEDYSKLEEYYEQKFESNLFILLLYCFLLILNHLNSLLNLVKEQSPKTHYIIWQEVITHRVKVKPETVVEIWKEPWTEVMAIVTALGHRTILSSCWYLNYIIYGSDWKKYYRCEPTEFIGILFVIYRYFLLNVSVIIKHNDVRSNQTQSTNFTTVFI